MYYIPMIWQLTLSSWAATQKGTCLQDNFRSREIYGSPSSSGGRLHAIYASLIASQSGGVLNPILCAVHLKHFKEVVGLRGKNTAGVSKAGVPVM